MLFNTRQLGKNTGEYNTALTDCVQSASDVIIIKLTAGTRE